MQRKGDPLENAVAERVNGIIKDEYLYDHQVSSNKEARTLLDDTITLYNTDRPHMSIGNFTPLQIHQSTNPIKTEKLWKNYYRKKQAPVNQLQD